MCMKFNISRFNFLLYIAIFQFEPILDLNGLYFVFFLKKKNFKSLILFQPKDEIIIESLKLFVVLKNCDIQFSSDFCVKKKWYFVHLCV
jgi:hypothetical protein